MDEEHHEEYPQEAIATEQEQQPSMSLRAQYIKDLSFENPHAPMSLFNQEQAPKVDLNIELAASTIGENTYELSMQFTIRASADKTIFITELAYAGVFEITGVPAERLDQVLFIDCAFMLFPFARRVIADVTRDGGFPPLLLDPVDFVSLYMRRQQEQQTTAEAMV